MRKKYSLLFLVPAALILQVDSGLAAPKRGEDVRWEGSVGDRASKIWIHNLGDRQAEASLEAVAEGGRASAAERVSVAAGAGVEVPAMLPGDSRRLRLRSAADLFVLEGPEDFDTRTIEIAGAPAVRHDRARRGPVAVRAEWARRLIAGGPTLEKGNTASAIVETDDPDAQVEVALAFREPGSVARIRLLDADGREVASVLASSSKPVQWRATLGRMPSGGSGRVEVEVVSGLVHATAQATGGGKKDPGDPVVIAMTGSAYYNYDINWWHTPNLYFSVAGGPANTCGDVWVYRNSGPWQETQGWICTDGSGNATKGPWSWSGQSGDETAYAYVEWPGGSTTNTATHIWDKTKPSVDISSPGGSPPSSFYGSASDAAWGAGFDDDWADCIMAFEHFDFGTSTSSYWTPTSGGYNTTTNIYVPCTISGMPDLDVTWSAPSGSIPPTNAHQSGECYWWYVWVYDGGFYSDPDIHSFCS